MDTNVYNIVTPRKILAYLRLNEWEPLKDISRLPYTTYKKSNSLYEQVQIPKEADIDSRSYQSFVDDMLYKIAKYDQKDVNQVINEISNIDKKIIYIRYFNERMSNYNIPAKEMMNLIDNSKRLFISAYADANLSVEDRLEFRRGSYPKDIQTIMDKMEFGQTQEGSYIIPMIVPLSDENGINEDIFINAGINFDEETDTETQLDPTEKAIEKMIESISIVKNEIDMNNNLERFLDKNSQDFTSINYLNSLSNIGNESPDIIVEFFSTIKEKGKKTYKSAISSKYYSAINQFVESYKAQHDTANKFTGKLRRIDVEPNIFDRTVIKAKLEGQAFNSEDSKIKKLDCEFPYENHEHVFNAIENGHTVIVEGEREGNKLLNCSLRVIE